MHIFTFTQKPKSRVTEIETIKPESEEKKEKDKALWFNRKGNI